MTVSVTSICNRALQHLGAQRILDITDVSRNGKACASAYDSVRRSELRKHPWRFAMKRDVLAPLATTPAFDFQYQFQMPADCLRIIKPRDPYLDWEVEGRLILTNDTNTLQLRYIADVADPNTFDALFCEALALKMAEAMCEEITQSNTKKASIQAAYNDIIKEAKTTNAMETLPVEPNDDGYWIARL